MQINFNCRLKRNMISRESDNIIFILYLVIS